MNRPKKRSKSGFEPNNVFYDESSSESSDGKEVAKVVDLTVEGKRARSAQTGSNLQPPKPRRVANPPPSTGSSKTQAIYISSYEDSEESGSNKSDDFLSLGNFKGSQISNGVFPDLEMGLTPWFDEHEYNYDLAPHKRMQFEMVKFIEYLEPTKAEIYVKRWLLEKIRGLVVTQWPKANVELYGSFRTGLYLPQSDLDISITIESVQANRNGIIQVLSQLYTSFIQSLEFMKVDFRSNAKIPIINMIHKQTGIEIDLSVNTASGLESGKIVKRYVDECPSLRSLILFFKLFLANRGLNVSFEGGMGSYGITLLVISFFQLHPQLLHGSVRPEKNLAVLMFEIFELYGLHFNFGSVGINLQDGGSYFPRNRSKNGPFHQFMVEDPQDQKNNVMGNVRKGPFIKRVFRDAFQALTSWVNAYSEQYLALRDGPTNPKKRLRETSLLGTVVTIPETMIKHRASLQEVYNGLIEQQP